MYCKKLSRTDFAKLLFEWKGTSSTQSSRDLEKIIRPPSHDELIVCWPVDEQAADDLPRLVVVSDETIHDFLAWAITFIPSYRPLTSFVRVLPWSHFVAFQNKKLSISTEKASALVGLILAEALSNGGRAFVDALPITAFESTYSFAAGRAYFLGYDDSILKYVFHSWHAARELGESRNRKLSPEALSSFWRLITMILNRRSESFSTFALSGAENDLIRACEELSERGHISSHSLTRLSRGIFPLEQFGEAVNLPREQRVKAFDSTMRQLVDIPTSDISLNFIVGYLASLVSDGSLEHAHLLYQFQPQFPTAILWYGLCASLVPSSRVMIDNGHVGLRILRILQKQESILSPPASDIQLQEFEVLLRGQLRSRFFRQSYASSVRIELVPGVTTLIRPMGGQPSGDQLGLFAEEPRQTQLEYEKLSEIAFSLKRSLSVVESALANTANSPATVKAKRKS